MARTITIDETKLAKEIGARIRASRLSQGISQETLGDALGVTFQMIQKYENGSCRVPSARIISLAQALTTSPLYLLLGQDTVDMTTRVPLTKKELQLQAKLLQRTLEKQYPASPKIQAARHALTAWITLVDAI
jgi:transcriptional regulator with XRE-family HTH domain